VTTTRLPARLQATTREVEPAPDPLATFHPAGFAWLHDGTRLVTEGVVARVAPGEIDAALAAIDADDPVGLPGSGPVAVGALPFDPSSPGELVIPARIRGHRAGRAWVTDIGAVDAEPRVHADAPMRFTISAPRTRAMWEEAVVAALGAIARGELEKVVLAREVKIDADSPFDITGVLHRLVAQQHGCFVYASEGFVGASPELLVARHGATVESRPVAGTTVADGDDATLDALAHSAKDNREHRFVVDAIADALGRVCDTLDVAPVPEVGIFGPVAHLATPVRGRLAEPAASALELARLLSPTPAVGGTPRAPALAAIAALEGFDRGPYAGPVGWVDARGDGEWAIALRCAEIDGPRARLVAGAGIVDGSDPDAEWAETQAKLEPMLRALIRP
jgi:menaquinone-specific isochorismate synthase